MKNSSILKGGLRGTLVKLVMETGLVPFAPLRWRHHLEIGCPSPIDHVKDYNENQKRAKKGAGFFVR